MYLHAQSLRIRNIHPLDGSWPRAKRKTAKQSLYESSTSACDKSVAYPWAVTAITHAASTPQSYDRTLAATVAAGIDSVAPRQLLQM